MSTTPEYAPTKKQDQEFESCMIRLNMANGHGVQCPKLHHIYTTFLNSAGYTALKYNDGTHVCGPQIKKRVSMFFGNPSNK